MVWKSWYWRHNVKRSNIYFWKTSRYNSYYMMEKNQNNRSTFIPCEVTGWIPASMLKEEEILSLEDGREVPVQSIETITYNHYVNVYNFEVKDFHIYYISDVSVLST